MKKNNQKSKEKIFKSGEVMSILENMSDGIQLVAEQHGEIMIKLKEHDDKFDNLEIKIDEINERLNRVGDDVIEVKHKLSEKVDREEFEKLEKRMVKLEKLVFARLA